jgi:hypothetical protein
MPSTSADDPLRAITRKPRVRAHRPRIAGPTPRPQLAGSLDTQPQLKARMSRPMSTTAMTKALDQITFSFEFNRRISDDHPSC